MTVVGVLLIILSRAVPSGLEGTLGFIDRSNELLAMGIFFVLSPWIPTLWIALTMRGRARRADALRSDGVECEAEVLDVRETGTSINDQIQYGVSLRVHPDGEEPFSTDVRACVGRENLDCLRIGNRLRAWYDPGSGSLLVEFSGGRIESPGAAPGPL